MALAPKLSQASRNLALNAALDVLNNGFVDILSGTKPTNADTALSGNTVLAVCTFGATAFGAAAGAEPCTKTANAIGSDSSADATGTASFYRMYKSDHTTAVWDGTVGTSGCDLNLNSTAIQAGTTVSITSCVASMAA